MTTPNLQDIMEQLQAQVEQSAQGPAEVPAMDAEGRGTAADDRITVVLRGGKVDEIEIQPLALRLSNADLAEAVKDAVNAAIDDHNERLMAQLQSQQTDFGSLQRSLVEIQHEANRAMEAYAHGLNDALRKAAARD